MKAATTRRYRDRVACCFSLGRVLLLNVTHACNQHCIHCLREAVPARAKPLDMEVLSPELARAVQQLKIERVVISGGEPMLVPNLLTLISLVDGLGVRASLCSNATLIDAPRASALAVAGLASCTVGLDGAGEHYVRFRGGSTAGYGRALAGISALADAGVAVTVNVSVHDSVLDQADELAEDLRGRGLRSLCVTSPIIQGRLVESLASFSRVTWPAVHDFANLMAELMDCPVSLRAPRCDRASCPSGRTVFALGRDGEITACPDVGAVNVGDHHAMAAAVAAHGG